MRVVRIDQIAPGGAALEVHPRLTLVRGASPELRRRLRGTVRSLCGDGELAESGVIEVSGVQLSLDRSTVDQLRIEPGIDPFLQLGPASVPHAAPPYGASQLPPPVEVVSSDEADLRNELRSVTSARTALGARMETARAGLDSFSSAALDVCLGQIEALESRRATLRVDWERERVEREAQLDAASAQLAGVRTLADRIAMLGAVHARVRDGREDLLAAVERATVPDSAAVQLAAQLDAAAARVLDLADRHDHDRSRLARAEEELAAARAAADEAERAVRSPRVDRSVIQRLEAVRDEIFAVDDRQSVLGAARNKRRVAELRSEEAILLDRLGFDTYSAYVMGIPSVRADLERASQVSVARQFADELEAEVAVLRTRVADRSELDDGAAQLHRLLVDALRVLAEPADVRSPDELAHSVAIGGDAAELVRGAAASLRRRTSADPLSTRGAGSELSEALREAAAAVSAIRFDLPAGPAELPSIPPQLVESSADPLTQADQWLRWHDDLHAWHSATEVSVVELERRVADLGAGPDSQRIGRWAEVEAELDEALDRLADAQERVRAHEVATAQLAELRVRELELRDQERALLAGIAAADAAIVPPQPPPTPPPPPASDRAVAPFGDLIDRDDPEAVEWAVIDRLSRQRTVSFVGSMPLLVEGLPAGAEAGDAVLRRLDRMSDLIQVIIVDDDDASVARVGLLGDRARCVEL